MSSPVIRSAVPEDIAEIRQLIVELAVYEKEPDAVKLTEEKLANDVFAEHPAVFVYVAEAPAGSGHRIDGFALWFLNYSTWEGVHGIYLEDLFVREDSRGSGAGKALLRSLAQTAIDRGYKRVEWCVLKWNEPSIGFYKSLGAFPQDEWDTYRLTGDALEQFAQS
ncbi:GNAT family N-acetyltransferase [Rothia uropygioeca]|uniref:GNAT family N-acetyltransferase n=1 Tax=Kocuria sp. 257 TaxID=2021970 RepID=UPI001013095D|nr:GNAT family N-acetyltransferase [Kocuria sp. 257]